MPRLALAGEYWLLTTNLDPILISSGHLLPISLARPSGNLAIAELVLEIIEDPIFLPCHDIRIRTGFNAIPNLSHDFFKILSRLFRKFTARTSLRNVEGPRDI